MSEPQEPDSTPPEVPEEFAAAYRAAYERALAAQSAQTHRKPEDSEDEDVPSRSGRIRLGTHRARPRNDEPAEDAASATPSRTEAVTHSAWFVPVLLALLVLLLIIGAYAVGRVFAGRVQSSDVPAPTPNVAHGGGGNGESSRSAEPRATSSAKPWGGGVQTVGDATAQARCTSPPGTDASGDRVDYAAANMTDGEPDTTWRCDGTAVGEKILLRLGGETAVGQVGLIPGYAKTDDKTEADRYAENNRITRVRWTIGDTVVEQRLSGDPQDRSMRLLRVPRTTAKTVELEILAVAKGSRDTTAISEVRVGRAG